VASRVGSGERRCSASELDGLWSDLRRTLVRLEAIAGGPAEELDSDDAAEELARLRYALHVAGERAYGLVEAEGPGTELEELADALAEARDATAEVADSVELGDGEATAELVPEWRGALFRVRLARLRLDRRAPAARRARDDEPEPGLLGPLLSLVLTVIGASLVVLGAAVGAWPVWSAGVAAVVAGVLCWRP